MTSISDLTHIHTHAHALTHTREPHTCEQTLDFLLLRGLAEYVLCRKEHFSKSLHGKQCGCGESVCGLLNNYSLFYKFLPGIFISCPGIRIHQELLPSVGSTWQFIQANMATILLVANSRTEQTSILASGD